jgi:hypothetical protein
MPTISMFYGILVAWIELHRDELMADWILASSGQTLFKVISSKELTRSAGTPPFEKGGSGGILTGDHDAALSY